MNKQQAQQIIRDTFESPFDKSRFAVFIKNLLNWIDDDAPFTYQGNYIPDAYKQYIKVLERIGKFSDGENSIDILVITLQKETSLERARTMQRNFIAWYLNGSRGGDLKDAALAAFVSPDEVDWRFSLVKMDYKFEQTKTGKMKVKEEFTPARRWSFLVGANEKSHTAQSRLVNILANDEQEPTLREIENAFDIETVTKEFFLKYRELFLRTKEELDRVVKKDPKVEVDFEAKGMDTVNFAKKLLGQIVFLYFLQKKGWFGVGRDADWGDGSKHFLRELFKKKHADYSNFFNDILEPLFYEALRIDRSHVDGYYSRFNCKIPFLNGGLFDPIGNYDWVHTDIIIPDKLFSNNIKTKEGDTGNGILDIFDRFNFTVKEDEPLEKEVAIDPELLGKIYEKFNAIRPDNYDEFKTVLKAGKTGEENKFNKKFGVYYTPREIVHYMCQQSLIVYLATELEGNTNMEDIETLIHTGEQVSENEAAIQAKGRETRDYSYKLPESIRQNVEMIDLALANITVCDPAIGSGAFPVGMMHEIVKTRNLLSTYLKDPNRSIYNFKRKCIEKSLYGVDIDPGAVEIAKLRLWLSLVVDEEDIQRIKPLPNLDYKIICGNSLQNVEKNLFNSQLFSKLEKLKPIHLNETNPSKRHEYKKQIDDLISQITRGHEEFNFEVYFSEAFHENNGFHIVIGNPPWGQKSVKFSKAEKGMYEILYPSAMKGSLDIFRLFVQKSIQLTAPQGIFANVLPDIILLKNYSTTRKYILDNLRIIRIDHWGMAFENVNLDSCTLLGQKISTENNNIIATIHSDNETIPKIIPQSQFLQIDGYKFNLYLNTESLDLINKLKRQGMFGDFFEPHEGIHSGNIREKLFVDSKSNNYSKKLILGRDEIKRYLLTWNGLWVNYNPRLVNKSKGEYAGLGKKEYFDRQKIIVRRTGDYILAALDEEEYYFSNNVFVCLPKVNCTLDMKYVLGVLNSKLATWFYRKIQPRKGKLFAELKINVLKQIPIKEILENDQRKIVRLVEKIITAKKGNPKFDTILIENEIDEAIYMIFNLTRKERNLIEKES